MRSNLVDIAHGLDSVISISLRGEPEGFVGPDPMSAHVRAGALHEGHQLELLQTRSCKCERYSWS